MDIPLVPACGVRALADVVPALLSGLGVRGFADRLALHPARGVCLLLVDGLGWQALRAHPQDAPFLTSLTGGSEPITAGFPATTATSVAAIGTGLPAGQHGIVGFSFAIPDGSLINALTWGTHDRGDRTDLRNRFVPEDIQPVRTALERAADAGVRVTLAVPHPHQGTGLTRAVLRGGEVRGVHALGDLASTALLSMSAANGHSATPTTATWTCSVIGTAPGRCRGGCNWPTLTDWPPRSPKDFRRTPSSW